jgi:hypothetical protein
MNEAFKMMVANTAYALQHGPMAGAQPGGVPPMDYSATTDPGWESCDPMFKKRLITGERAAGPLLMRKRVDGKWIYRRMTVREESDFVSSTAW